MATVLVYAYATGTFSSRKIAIKLEEDVAYRVLGAGNFPAHRTIADFRQRHLAVFEALFVQVVRIAREMGVVRLGKLAIDGTKMGANASKRKAMSYGRMKSEEQRLETEIASLSARAQAADQAEDSELGVDVRGDELPEAIRRREQRLAKIAAAKARLEERQAEADRARGRKPEDGRQSRSSMPFARDFGVPKATAQDNFTDPDSRIMKTAHGFDQCYNAQIAVDEETQLIVATTLSRCAGDHTQLLPVLDNAAANLARQPAELLADAGYRSEENFAELERRGIPAYISMGREGKRALRPPMGAASQRMAERLSTAIGRERYRRRKAVVEPVFGWIKQAIGFRRFSVRGESKVRCEWHLVCLATNLKRLRRLQMA